MTGVRAPRARRATTDEADRWLARLNEDVGRRGRITREPSVPFGAEVIERFRLGNGLRILVVTSRHAKVVSFHTWFGVGSRHERPGKTGLAHLFEHLMFNETRNLPAGTFDRKLESIGASTNAATWNDWTYYHEDLPSEALATVIALESERMKHLVLRLPQVTSEIEVVANERRYRVDDDVDGAINELLYKTAFDHHAYHHPTIGWMEDILAFTPADCERFYKTYYAPNNAVLVVVGDVEVPRLLKLVQKHYGDISSSKLPPEDAQPEPAQRAERVVRLRKPTPTARVAIGYKSPALADPEHAALSVLCEALFGGRSARLFRAIVTEREVATDLAASVAQFRDPGLFELYATAREGTDADALLAAIDREIDALASDPLSEDERERAIARLELGFLQGLESVGGRAEQIGFYETVLGDPAGSLTRLDALRRVTRESLISATERFLSRESRTIVLVDPEPDGAGAARAHADDGVDADDEVSE